MRVAVITPFHRVRRDWLAQCHASIRAQTWPCVHFLVSDGAGENPLADFRGRFLRLDRCHADFGDTPRAVGSMVAIGESFEAIAYLDDDNWFEPWHIEKLLDMHRQTGAAICTSARALYDLDGLLLGTCQESDGENFVDTNCLLLTAPAFGLISNWVLKPAAFLGVGYGDFYLWQTLKRSGLKRAHSPSPGVAYRSTWPVHYQTFGRPPPKEAKSMEHCLFNERLRNDMMDHFSRQGH